MHFGVFVEELRHRAVQSSALRDVPARILSHEVRPSEIAGFRNPFHVVAIPNMGLTLGEIFCLEDLAAACAADGRYAFLLVAPPLPVTRAAGTPINPYALK